MAFAGVQGSHLIAEPDSFRQKPARAAAKKRRNNILLFRTKPRPNTFERLFIDVSHDDSTAKATEDIAIMRTLANMTIYSPCDYVTARRLVDISLCSDKGPIYIRLDKGEYNLLHSDTEDLSLGYKIVNRGKDVCIVATGIMVHKAIGVKPLLEKQGVSVTIIDLFRLKPMAMDLGNILSAII